MRLLLAVCLLTILPALAMAQSAGLSGSALERANAERQERGLPPLGTDPRLARAAEEQAAHMARVGRMTHRGPRGEDIMRRVRGAGFRSCFAAENVAFGQPDGNAVTTAWMGSASHRRNILDKRASVAAVAGARRADGVIYWAMILAAPC
ncbi:CAP domain-containing protein [Jannaschia seohaensis]|uniref:Uncharacterized conserved protein YkwD, contains CAP (CSP/antigen 5/PR1) domain n=1 Tax=Jannaschia seohaensis TaxID=475081 RepID=A0A2Y9C0R1_9RHOB|nr:CAP domain-containing protein [Jannaschia seohaensis]PWJ18187.1 uncharacterized protein YkwD [Jannaschia seohaensis]SSA46712.1 Uncharacterized conserved protein YkwD, contains CAP (CSP/antigen 5/PR1) domain [Jannaschia seohaensis]